MKSKFIFEIVPVVLLVVIFLTACQKNVGSSAGATETGAEPHSSQEIESVQKPEGSKTETVDSEIPTETESETEIVDLHEYDFTLCFGGDISLDEEAVTTAQLDKSKNGIYDCISPELMSIMQQADIMCLNNEFTFSTSGEAMNGKAYTFRANPDRVAVLQEMGVDVVTLANNHVYDYGKQALLDTFTTLENAGIQYFGAGKNLEDISINIEIDENGIVKEKQ